MKKLIFAICLAFLSVGAYASSPTISESSTFTQVANHTNLRISKQLNQFVDAHYTIKTSCGSVWTVTAPDNAPTSAHNAARVQRKLLVVPILFT